ncbi:hypothetical protein NUKP55_11470 [Klebsiella variicola]|uniref:hypothetical protein n=1 Tax=Klebsiella pneumoniae complex TaxID=3390273 RepID=UPI0007CD1C77|nr:MULTISPECIES: hypothetical protein [Klebsiella]MBV0335492.1 hypothetical protein [Klebsiella pneumoniae]MDU1898446.1 hypothetical protein [Klebsiella pneumoniae]MDV0545815.1 hypothetical protein [Klebsiella quasipneumoniae subsp. similipneumoniae]WAD56570.1 hypothetical protein OT489_20120 [Klebsiella pneumoniae]SAV02020.1 Uncharacterised protein [Klebsiella pneumoniae]
MEFVGFHGTDSANENSIFQLNFTVSAKSDEWLGTGAYFFLDGVGDPTEHADSWAKLHAYDRDSRSNRYTDYVVISAKINVANVLNMDTDEGRNAFNVYRDYIKNDHRIQGVKPSKSLIVNDCVVFNHILANTEFDAIINCEYIKLDRWSRMRDYKSRIPNCRVMSVKEPTASINVQELNVVRRGVV